MENKVLNSKILTYNIFILSKTKKHVKFLRVTQ